MGVITRLVEAGSNRKDKIPRCDDCKRNPADYYCTHSTDMKIRCQNCDIEFHTEKKVNHQIVIIQ